MAVTTQRDWVARELAREVSDAEREGQRDKYAHLLARIAPKVDPYHAPIGVDPSWQAIPVGLESLDAPTPQADYEAEALQAIAVLVAACEARVTPSNMLRWSLAATVSRLDDDRSNTRAAQRAQLLEPTGYGETTRMAVLVEHHGITRKAIVTGTAAEIAQALPTSDRIAEWKALGVTEVPAWSLTGTDDIRQRMAWVPIDEAPVLLRMESVERAASV